MELVPKTHIDPSKIRGPYSLLALFLLVIDGVICFWLSKAEGMAERIIAGFIMASIFILFLVVVVNIAKVKSKPNAPTLKGHISHDMSTTHDLRISDILVQSQKTERTCTLDFRVVNRGSVEVFISRVKLKVLDVISDFTLGYLEFSKEYDLDISNLRQKGDEVELAVSQVVEPRGADRFGITLVAGKMATGELRQWILEPSLVIGQSVVVGEEIEVWLPFDPREPSLDT